MKPEQRKAAFEVGQTVYVHEKFSDGIIQATITKISDEDNRCTVRFGCTVDKRGLVICRFVGESERYFEDIWVSAKEAYSAIEGRKKRAANVYVDQIKTVEDLLRFPLEHCILGEEYTDIPALEAYEIRAKELLGIDLDQPENAGHARD